MKKFLYVLFLLLSLSLALYGCGDSSGGGSGDGGSNDDGETVKYTISWIDEKGTLISQQSVEENTVPSYAYTVSDTQEWDYTFNGWAESRDGEVLSEIPKATKDVSYYAKVSATKQKYIVKFNSLGGTDVESQTVEYGAKASAPDAPKYEGYKFMGWSTSESGNEIADFDAAITGNVEYYAIWNEMVDVKELLASLLSGYKLDPLSYIPETMLSGYYNNLVDAESIVSDYSGFVNVSDISYGHGEQWRMVLDNIEQSETFFNVLSVVDSLTAVSVTAFNNYFDTNPQDTAHHVFESGIYNVTINFDGEIISYVLDYTAEIPVLGVQTVQIALAMNAQSGEKTVRIQLGDANALAYKMTDDSYEFAIKYLGARSAMFTVKKADNGEVAGSIYEYINVSSVEIASSAEFYITDDYVSVVGNKASGMIGFTGYITELYDAQNGKMLGYEVQEKLYNIVYNTLWLNLDSVLGIETIKHERNSDSEELFYVNGSSAKWETKKVGGISEKAFSRRFDIEFRTQYVYSYDQATEKYTVHQIEVPMIFVQEENVDTFVSDVYLTNGVNISVMLNSTDLEKMFADYASLIPLFVQNKDSVTVDKITAYIGNKISFE